MAKLQFLLNMSKIEEEINPGITLLDYLRYRKNLAGTKIGCREGDCGACTVLVGEMIDGELIYRNITSCLTPMANIHGKHVVSIEGINLDNGELTLAQQYMVETGGTQCGFCTVGFIVSLTGYALNYHYDKENGVINAIAGNICRCTGYKSIERAAFKLEKSLSELDMGENWIDQLVNNQYVPQYFNEIIQKLEDLDVEYKDIETTHQQIGGGTDLYVQRHDELIELNLSFLNPLSSHNIEIDGNNIRMDANITATQFAANKHIQDRIQGIDRYFDLIASAPIRNIATLAGNIVNASPIADFVSMLIVFNTQLHLNSGRKVALDQFYTGYKQFDLEADEIITQLEFELPEDLKFNFEKVSKRKNLDIASVNSSILIIERDGVIETCRISAGGVAPYPLYLEATSEYLHGKVVTYEIIQEAVEMANSEIAPISDIRGSEKYKRLLLRQLVYAHFMELYPDEIGEVRRLIA